MSKSKIVTPAQKATAAAAKAEIAKAAAKAAAAKTTPVVKGDQTTIPGAAPTPNKAPKAAKAAKAPAPPKAKTERPKRPEGLPDHWTLSGNKKHQCNGPQAWSAVFQAAAKKELGETGREGDGVRLALALGVEALAKKHGIKIPAAKPLAVAVAK